jgi:hypothetical protein
MSETQPSESALRAFFVARIEQHYPRGGSHHAQVMQAFEHALRDAKTCWCGLSEGDGIHFFGGYCPMHGTDQDGPSSTLPGTPED